MVEFSTTLAIISAEYRPNRWGARRCNIRKYNPKNLKLASLDNVLEKTAEYILNLPTRDKKTKKKSIEYNL